MPLHVSGACFSNGATGPDNTGERAPSPPDWQASGLGVTRLGGKVGSRGLSRCPGEKVKKAPLTGEQCAGPVRVP